MCRNVPLFLGPYDFKADFYILSISEEELVLGVEWLKTLGPFTFDKMTMHICRNDQIIEVSCMSKPSPNEASLHQFQLLTATDALNTVLELHLLTPTTKAIINIDPPPQILPLLTQYTNLFSPPKSLPIDTATSKRKILKHKSRKCFIMTLSNTTQVLFLPRSS